MAIRLAQGGTESPSLPVGTVMPWASAASPPAGWLALDGGEVPIDTYRALYNVVTGNGGSFPFGANTDGTGAPGSSHFRLPDLRGRAISPPGTVGATGGSTTHTHAFQADVVLNNVNTTMTLYAFDANAHGHTYTEGNFNSAGGHAHAMNEAGSNPSSSAQFLRQAGTNYNTVASFDAHSHGAITWNTSSAGDHGHTTSAVGNVVDESGHFHALEVKSTPVSPPAVSHVPPHVRLTYCVLAVAT